MPKEKEMIFQTAFSIYKTIESVGSGGSGNVIKVNDQDGNTFALKYLDPNKITTEKVKRFKNELFFCFKNEHPNIIKVNDWGYFEINKIICPFYIMPYYKKTLRDIIQNRQSNDKMFFIFSQILDGIEAAHLLNIWHRDIKPENILFNPDTEKIVISDFGIAHFEEEYLYTFIETKAQSRLANFQYAAPEQRERGKTVDHRADIYSLGMILNEIFTGELPLGVDFKKIKDIYPDYAYLDDLIDNMLKKFPEHRPNSIDEIKKQLIARQNDFISRQKISQLKNTVIPFSEPDDPLIANPVSVGEMDYQNGKLIFFLKPFINGIWEFSFKSLGGYSFINGFEPRHFDFETDRATISVPDDENLIRTVSSNFHEYVNKTNQEYKNRVLEGIKKKQRSEQEKLQREIEEEEKRQQILKIFR